MPGRAERARSQGGADRLLGRDGVMGMVARSEARGSTHQGRAVAQQIQYGQNLKGKCNGGVEGLEGASEGGAKRPAILGRGSGRGRQGG